MGKCLVLGGVTFKNRGHLASRYIPAPMDPLRGRNLPQVQPSSPQFFPLNKKWWILQVAGFQQRSHFCCRTLSDSPRPIPEILNQHPDIFQKFHVKNPTGLLALDNGILAAQVTSFWVKISFIKIISCHWWSWLAPKRDSYFKLEATKKNKPKHVSKRM